MNIGGNYGKAKEQLDRCASWLEEIRSASHRRVSPPTEEDWDLDPAVAARVLANKKNWISPGPDRLVNFWWRHVNVTTAFQAISSIDGEYPLWFSEGKTSLIPKSGEFTSDNQRPITCLNTMYK